MRILQVSLLIASIAVVAFPQGTGTLTELKGTVVDQAGMAIASTRVVLSDGNGKTYEALSDEDGVYLVRVPAGTYTLQAEYTKHQAWEKFRVEKYHIAETKRMLLDICLAVGKKFTETNGSPVYGKPIGQPKKPGRR